MPFNLLRGFRDYPPPEAGARSEIRRRMRSAARRAGYSELEGPCVESFELYQIKSGEGIAAETWLFRDKGERPVALVPETTPSLARIFVDRAKSEPLPVKWFTVSKIWRYEEPQAGRTREFLQFNLDLLGVPGVEAEADLLSTAALLLDEVGAVGLYAFRINDRAIAEGIGSLFGVQDVGRFFRAVDRYHKVPPAEFEGEIIQAGVSPEAAAELAALFASAGPGVPPAGVDRFLADLEARGLNEAGRAGSSGCGTCSVCWGRPGSATESSTTRRSSEGLRTTPPPCSRPTRARATVALCSAGAGTTTSSSCSKAPPRPRPGSRSGTRRSRSCSRGRGDGRTGSRRSIPTWSSTTPCGWRRRWNWCRSSGGPVRVRTATCSVARCPASSGKPRAAVPVVR